MRIIDVASLMRMCEKPRSTVSIAKTEITEDVARVDRKKKKKNVDWNTCNEKWRLKMNNDCKKKTVIASRVKENKSKARMIHVNL